MIRARRRFTTYRALLLATKPMKFTLERPTVSRIPTDTSLDLLSGAGIGVDSLSPKRSLGIVEEEVLSSEC